MHRARARFVGIANGTITSSGSDEARDALFHFFQDAYHLKDWLKNDPNQLKVGNQAIEDAVKPSGSAELALAADVCNGTKHFRLRSTKTGDLSTAVTTQSVDVRPQTIQAHVSPSGVAIKKPSGEGYVVHTWTVESNQKIYDAEDLAGKVLAAWDAWLCAQGLL